MWFLPIFIKSLFSNHKINEVNNFYIDLLIFLRSTIIILGYYIEPGVITLNVKGLNNLNCKF